MPQGDTDKNDKFIMQKMAVKFHQRSKYTMALYQKNICHKEYNLHGKVSYLFSQSAQFSHYAALLRAKNFKIELFKNP